MERKRGEKKFGHILLTCTELSQTSNFILLNKLRWLHSKFTSEEEDVTKIVLFMEEATRLISSLNIEAVTHIFRENNNMAHTLARRACESDTSCCWLNSFPS